MQGLTKIDQLVKEFDEAVTQSTFKGSNRIFSAQSKLKVCRSLNSVKSIADARIIDISKYVYDNSIHREKYKNYISVHSLLYSWDKIYNEEGFSSGDHSLEEKTLQEIVKEFVNKTPVFGWTSLIDYLGKDVYTIPVRDILGEMGYERSAIVTPIGRRSLWHPSSMDYDIAALLFCEHQNIPTEIEQETDEVNDSNSTSQVNLGDMEDLIYFLKVNHSDILRDYLKERLMSNIDNAVNELLEDL